MIFILLLLSLSLLLTLTLSKNATIKSSILLSNKIISNCCNIDSNGIDNISKCINNNNNKYGWLSLYKDDNDIFDNNRKITFAIVSYSDNNIDDYSTYSYAINNIWSEANGYTLRLYTSNDNINYDHYDSRWNKIIVINDALNEWANHYDYIVWMDSDLIIINIEMKLEYIVYQYNNADLIFSKDPRVENGIVNTGMFIVKNTKWSKDFIDRWWNKYDRSQGMDQHIFDKLWYDDVHDMKEHVALLPADEINSHFPAWINQKDTNNVLHLAGTSNLFRKLSFQLALDEICYSYHQCSLADNELLTTCPIKSQLGLDQVTLMELYKNSSTSMTIMNLLYEGHGIDLHSYFVNQTVLDLLIDIKGRLANQRQSGYNSVSDNVSSFTLFSTNSNDVDIKVSNNDDKKTCNLLEVFMSNTSLVAYDYDQKLMTLQSLRWVYCSMHKLLHLSMPDIDDIDNSNLSLSFELAKGLPILLQNLLDASFDLLAYNDNYDENYIILQRVSPYVDLFISVVPSDIKHIALYYKVKHREFISNCCRDLHNSQCQLQYLFETYKVWKELDSLHWYGAGNGIANPYKEYSETLVALATLLCLNNRAEEGLIYAQESLRMTKNIWADSNEFNKEIPDFVYLSLISKNIVAGECAKRCWNTQSHVIEYANDASNVLERFHNASSNKYVNEYVTFNELINNLKIPIKSFDSNCSSSNNANKHKKWLKKKL